MSSVNDSAKLSKFADHKTPFWDWWDKYELKLFMYQFHNTVSHKKGMPTPDITVLDQYKHSNLRHATQLFAKHFTTNAPGLMTQQMKRRSVVAQTLRTLHRNWNLFDN